MSDTTYITTVGSFGYLRNRKAIEDGAMKGLTVPPLVDYLPEGSQVELDPDSDHTKKLVASGAIEIPGASAERRKAELQAELDRLNAERDALNARLAPADLKGKALDDALEAAGLSTEGSADEKRARLAEATPPSA